MSTLVYATPVHSAPAHIYQHIFPIPGNMEDRLLKEHLARLRGSWRNENYQQSRAAHEVSTGVDRQWLTLRQAEERATDRRNQQLLREHHSYQQQLVRELAHGSSHQQRYYPPALAPRPSLTPAPLIMRAATRMGPPKRPAPPPPYQASGEPLRKRPCLSTPSSWPCREHEWELLVEQGRWHAGRPGPQLEQRNAVRQLQMWQAGPLAVGESLAQLVRGTPVGLFLPPAAPPAELMVLPSGTTIPCFPRLYPRSTPAASASASASPAAAAASKVPASAEPPAVSMMPQPGSTSLKERFAQHVMCRFTPMRPSDFQLSLWVSSGHLINLLQPHAPTEVLQLGPQKLTQLITEWYQDHPTYADLPYSYWCKNLKDKSNPPTAHTVKGTSIHFPLHDHHAANLVSTSGWHVNDAGRSLWVL